MLDLLWGGDETLVVVSTDLSHYHDFATARRMDAATSRAIEALEPEAIGYDDRLASSPSLIVVIAVVIVVVIAINARDRDFGHMRCPCMGGRQIRLTMDILVWRDNTMRG